MRYAIGAEFKDKKTGESYHGIVAENIFGMSYIHTDEEKDIDSSNTLIKVFETNEDAVLFSQILSRAYRRDDVWHSPKQKSKKIRRFYPIKIDSLNFKYKLFKSEDTKTSNISKDRFNNDTNEPTIHYKRYFIANK